MTQQNNGLCNPRRLILAQEKSILSTTPLVNNSLIVKTKIEGEKTPDIIFSSDLLTLMKGITNLLPIEYYMVSIFLLARLASYFISRLIITLENLGNQLQRHRRSYEPNPVCSTRRRDIRR